MIEDIYEGLSEDETSKLKSLEDEILEGHFDI